MPKPPGLKSGLAGRTLRSMGWFLRLMKELAIECRVGHPALIAATMSEDRVVPLERDPQLHCIIRGELSPPSPTPSQPVGGDVMETSAPNPV
jgi:hypothetical protein